MKIGEVAARLGTTTRTLRFYEEQGLIAPDRSPHGTRRYGEEDVARFATIIRLVGLGIPLAEIGALAAIRPASTSGDQASRQVESRLAALAAGLAQQRQHIERMERDIAHALHHLPRCHGCASKPRRNACDDCAVAPDLLHSEMMHIVWDR